LALAHNDFDFASSSITSQHQRQAAQGRGRRRRRRDVAWKLAILIALHLSDRGSGNLRERLNHDRIQQSNPCIKLREFVPGKVDWLG
jgi:hypothetical protein